MVPDLSNYLWEYNVVLPITTKDSSYNKWKYFKRLVHTQGLKLLLFAFLITEIWPKLSDCIYALFSFINKPTNVSQTNCGGGVQDQILTSNAVLH